MREQDDDHATSTEHAEQVEDFTPQREDVRVSASVELQTRDLRRRNELQDQLAKIQAGAPDRQTILEAIKNLQRLWAHLAMGERSRLMSQLVANIDHDTTDTTLSITLSPLGLESFATNNPEHSLLEE